MGNEDVLLLSPIRSIAQRYTTMGEYHGKNILYLGPKPTKQFITQCGVKYLYNCCTHSDDEDILKLPGVEEMLFNVGAWTHGHVDTDSEEEEEEESESEQDEDEKSDKYSAAIKQTDEEYVLHLTYEYL